MVLINVTSQLIQFPNIFVTLSESFHDYLRSCIIASYGSLKECNDKEFKLSLQTFTWPFKKKVGFNLQRLHKLCSILDIKYEKEILGYYCWGSRNKPIILSTNININVLFIEGFSLYIAEGDTGLSGKKKSRKLRLTNSEPSVINWWIEWIETCFPDQSYYVCVIKPFKGNYKNTISEIRSCNLVESFGKYNKEIKYRVCLDSAIVIDLLLTLETEIKRLCLKEPKFAIAYLKGLMAGEGTVYESKVSTYRYVRLEMKNSNEIAFAKRLFKLLKITYTYHRRSSRDGMEILYVGGIDNLKRFQKLIGFGCCEKRNIYLKHALARV